MEDGTVKREEQLVCTVCGATYNNGIKFCGFDAKPLVPATSTERLQLPLTKRCQQCGNDYPYRAQFCAIDGKILYVGSGLLDEWAQNAVHMAISQGDDEVVGKVFAIKYKVESLLGEGGMAKVFLATNTDIGKQVVIKLMHNHLSAKDEAAKRFEQEIAVTSKLNHPNLVSVLDGGLFERRPYLVMEYIKGTSLRSYMKANAPLAFDQIGSIILQVCSGLQEAHNEGIIHRDLKPENIMVRDRRDRPDWIKVLDFGIAHLKSGGRKLTETGKAIGTTDYMSPEYLQDKPIDHRSDIYALGVIMYELLTEHQPFESDRAEVIAIRTVFDTPNPPSSLREEIGASIDAVVLKALAKDPEERYQSTTELAQALQQATAL